MFSRTPKKKSERPVWHVVATTAGVLEAEVIAGRLESLGIPHYINREAVGSAFGLTIGPLGEASVLVPASHYRLAMATLYPDDEIERLENGSDEVGP